MILTGQEIIKGIKANDITVLPFDPSMVNPNSINYRLGTTIKKFVKFENNKSVFQSLELPESGLLLEPGVCYIGNTKEIIGSSKYPMSLIGRSSIARLGLFLQISANLGHTGSCHQWTLEIVACRPIKIYPNMRIGQVSFWTNYGDVKNYDGNYGKISTPQESLYL